MENYRLNCSKYYGETDTHDYLTNSQHGFRPCHSTTTTVLDITNGWYQNMDVGQLKGVVFLDF